MAICKPVELKVGKRTILSTELTYDDLKILYEQYIKKYCEVPIFSKCDLKHNMPQGRIINRILEENNVTYNDFLLQFGKVSHVRTESKNYDIFLEKYKEISKQKGRALLSSELTNNAYGLPNVTWFVKYCPDKNVKMYDDFVRWCGFESNKLEKDKEYVCQTLINLEKKLKRPITRNDISKDKTGFSMIVINRLFGGLTNAKKELGLMKTLPTQPRPFEYYQKSLDIILDNFKKNKNRDFISWYDIECDLYGDIHLEHKTLKKAFDRENVDLFEYIKSKGLMMNPSSFSNHYTFDNGERVVSSMEYDFSQYLNEIGYKYKETYYRDVMYKTFTDEQSKMNCDYKIIINDMPLYVEIAGIIYQSKNIDWHTHIFSSKKENDYKEKMLRKERLFLDNNCDFLILFRSDMVSDNYKKIFLDKVEEMKERT